jgi:peptide/nickel transport system ATP-binding protein
VTAAPAADLRIEGLSLVFDGPAGRAQVLDRLDLAIAPGEVLGLVGESGCGKSMTGLAILRLLPPRARVVAGRVMLAGRDLTLLAEAEMTRLRGRAVGMIFQDPAAALDPVYTIGGYLMETLRVVRGLDRRASRFEALRLLDRVGVPAAAARFHDYPHHLSGGMNQRVMIANALAAAPRFLVADEPTTALDVTTQAQILDLLREIRRDTGMGMLLITHDFGVVAELADRVAVMYCGRIVEHGPAQRVLRRPRHRYAAALLGSIPPLDRVTVLAPIAGTVPPLHDLPRGCHFAPRCAAHSALCVNETPTASAAAGDGYACHHPVPAE